MFFIIDDDVLITVKATMARAKSPPTKDIMTKVLLDGSVSFTGVSFPSLFDSAKLDVGEDVGPFSLSDGMIDG